MKRLLPFLLPVGLLLAAAGLGYRGAHRQAQLDEQLIAATAVLSAANEQVAEAAGGAVRGIEASVVKNRNFLPDVARFHRAERLHALVLRTRAALCACAHHLQSTASPTGPAARRWQRARSLLATCADSLHPMDPAPAPGALPAAPGTTTQALADLATAEYQLLRREAALLNTISRRVAYREHVFQLALAATAASSVVAPGTPYRAELYLATHAPGDLRQIMTCNGRPVPVDSLGIGRVRFRAPLRPGPAAWTGRIRISQNGRDTTFVVRVPYRVAPR